MNYTLEDDPDSGQALAAAAQGGNGITYVHDELGRLDGRRETVPRLRRLRQYNSHERHGYSAGGHSARGSSLSVVNGMGAESNPCVHREPLSFHSPRMGPGSAT